MTPRADLPGQAAIDLRGQLRVGTDLEAATADVTRVLPAVTASSTASATVNLRYGTTCRPARPAGKMALQHWGRMSRRLKQSMERRCARSVLETSRHVRPMFPSPSALPRPGAPARALVFERRARASKLGLSLPHTRLWRSEQPLTEPQITSFMRNVANYTDFADIVLIRRLVSITYLIPLPSDAVVTPITFVVPKRRADALRGFLR